MRSSTSIPWEPGWLEASHVIAPKTQSAEVGSGAIERAFRTHSSVLGRTSSVNTRRRGMNREPDSEGIDGMTRWPSDGRAMEPTWMDMRVPARQR